MSISEIKDVRVAKWGNSLAVRLPMALATELGGAGATVKLRAKVAAAGATAASRFGEDAQAPLGEEPGKAVIGKWGNSLAVRLPVDVAGELGLKEGDMLTLTAEDGKVVVEKERTRAEALESFLARRGVFTGSVQHPREDLLLRGPDVSD